MGTEKETIVLGAGLAGMVASIILAREGREVRVLESAKGLGERLADMKKIFTD